MEDAERHLCESLLYSFEAPNYSTKLQRERGGASSAILKLSTLPKLEEILSSIDLRMYLYFLCSWGVIKTFQVGIN